MRIKTALVLVVTLTLAACGGGKQKGVVKFKGSTPNTSLAVKRDNRAVSSHCPKCDDPLKIDEVRCPKVKTCGAKVEWDSTYTCGPCGGSGVCQACVWMENQKGQCYACRGEGFIAYQGKTPDCKNCSGKKVCPICAGTQKCDYCKGRKMFDKAEVMALVEKSNPPDGAADPAAKPEADTKKAEPKKEEPKKEEGKAPEEPKKEEAPKKE